MTQVVTGSSHLINTSSAPLSTGFSALTGTLLKKRIKRRVEKRERKKRPQKAKREAEDGKRKEPPINTKKAGSLTSLLKIIGFLTVKRF